MFFVDRHNECIKTLQVGAVLFFQYVAWQEATCNTLARFVPDMSRGTAVQITMLCSQGEQLGEIHRQTVQEPPCRAEMRCCAESDGDPEETFTNSVTLVIAIPACR